MYQTFEIGPQLNNTAPDFTLYNHEQERYTLSYLIGERGLLLGFTNDIWLPASIRRILWMQRHAAKIMNEGVNVAIVLHNQPHTLYGFYVSSPVPLPFPLLADVNHQVHAMYNMASHPGMILIDANCITREKWLMPDERLWPKSREIIDAVHLL